MKSSVVSLGFALMFAVACSPAQGGERGACFPNGTCNAGFQCLSAVCVARTDDSGTSDAASLDTAPTDAPIADAGAMDTPVVMEAAAPDVTSDTGNAADVPRPEAGTCPSANIFHPGSNEMRRLPLEVPFIGRGQDRNCALIADANLVWTDSIDGRIGTGSMFGYTFRSLGTHVVTLTATDSMGGVYRDRITLIIIP